MLKWIATLMNASILVLVVVIIFTEGLPDEGKERLAILVLIAFPVINLLYLLSTWHEESIVGLWLRVKKSELKKRLD